MKKYHYTYWLSSAPNENYIGVRSCNCKPEDDTEYMSSSKIVNQMIAEGKQFHKHILKVWPTRKEAMEHEILMHRVLDVGKNPLFLNKVRATSTGFDMSGLNHSKATKAKLSANNKGKFAGDKNPMYGKELSAATKAKISAKLKGFQHSDATRAKISAKLKGLQRSEAAKAKISAAKKGKKHSAAAKTKISAALKGDKHPNAYSVYDNETGITYTTKKAAVEATGISAHLIHHNTERFEYERRKIKKNSK